MSRPIVLQGDKKAVTRSGIGTFSGVVFGAGVAFGTTVFVSKVLGDEGAGAFFQILAFFAIATTACTFGAETGLVKTITAQVTIGDRDGIRKTLLIALAPVALFASAVAYALWWAAPTISGMLGTSESGELVRLLVLFIVPGSLLAALFGGLRGFGRVGTFTLLQNVLLPCLRFAAVASVTLVGLGTAALGAAWVVPVALVAVLAAFLLRSTVRTFRNHPAQAAAPRAIIAHKMTPFRRFWSFSAGRGASSLVEIVLEWIDVLFVGVFLGPAAAGVYGVVNRCVRLGQMADHSARIVVGPMLGAAMSTGDTARAQVIYLISTKLLVLVAWPFYLVLLISGPTLLTFFGPGFDAGYPALAVISVAMCLAVSAGGVQSVLLMAGRSRWQLYNKLAALAVAVTGNVLLIPLLGLRGAAISWAAAVLLDVVLATWEVHHFLRIQVSWRALALPSGLALAVYGVCFALTRVAFGPSWTNLAVSLAALTGLYALTVWRLRVPLGLAELRSDKA